MKRRALVTGGAGFIGSNLVLQLVKDGWDVTCVDDLSNGHKSFVENCDIKKIWVCFASERVLSLVRQGKFDIVFHHAANPRVAYSVKNPAQTTDDNVMKTVKLLEACRGNIDRLIFASSSSVYGDASNLPTPELNIHSPESPYALQKSCCEQFIQLFCKLYDFDAVCLRYFNVFGGNQYGNSPYSTAISAWCNAIADGRYLRSDGTGEQTRDMVHVDNVVYANILAANHKKTFEGACYNVGTGTSVSNNEILSYFEQRFNDIDVRSAPAREGDVMHTLADVKKISDELGYKPIVNFETGLKMTFDWWGL
jgi:nucleoside-diphosphate-sugar epimerase